MTAGMVWLIQMLPEQLELYRVLERQKDNEEKGAELDDQ